jgi:hypothetical protein
MAYLPRMRLTPALGAALAVAALAVVGGGSAAAKKSLVLRCTYVEAGPPGPQGNRLEIDGSQAEEDSLALRRVGDQIRVFNQILGPQIPTEGELTNSGKALQCADGTPTVTNVDQIIYTPAVNVGPHLEIDQRQGPFAPGATDEGDGSSEIEIDVKTLSTIVIGGTDGPDVIYAGRFHGQSGVNMNGQEATPDIDLTFPRRFELLTAIGLAGSDSISVAGGPGLAGPLQEPIGDDNEIHGGKGDDLLTGGPTADGLIGGPGNDLLRSRGGNDGLAPGPGRDRAFGGAGSDLFFAKDQRHDRLNCGPGPDLAIVDQRDSHRGCEEVFFSLSPTLQH